MIRLTTALLTLGVIIAIASTVTAHAQGQGDECFWVGCNPEAGVCRLFCGIDDINSPSQRPYSGIYPQQRSFHRHAKHHHKTEHYSG
jgi:hypothetical protein